MNERDADFTELMKKRAESTAQSDGAARPDGPAPREASDHGVRPASEDGDAGRPPVGAAEGGGDADALRAELDVAKDRYVRLLAEFENYKKRVLKERSEARKYEGERLVVDVLDVADDLDRAVEHADADPAQLKVGVGMIVRKLQDLFTRWEVKAESGIGLKFDPAVHHALGKMQKEGAEPGTIVGELRKAYFYKDKLLRHGEVVVASDPSDGDTVQ